MDRTKAQKKASMKKSLVHSFRLIATLSFVCAFTQQAFAAGPHATVVRQYRADTGVEIPFTTGTVLKPM
jgi:hypothetical protein